GTVADSGRLLRFTDVYKRMAGGIATLKGQGRGAEPMAGTLEIGNFQIVNEPTMERVVSSGVNTRGTEGFRADRVNFDRMVARFRRDERSITIEDALLRGREIGATFAGRYDVASTNLVMTGTYLPAYSFNNLFGQIP